MDLSGKNVLVIGMERTGLASLELLAGQGACLTAADTRPLAHLTLAAPVIERLGAHFRLQGDGPMTEFDAIVLSPGVPADLPVLQTARGHGVRVIGEVELAAPFLKGPVIGITGSNGKTTTTALAGHILAECGVPAQVGGNIGTPVTAMTATSREDQWNVLELSSFQLETIETFRAHIGVALNITQNHLDRHYTLENYANAKGRLFDHQTSGDFAVLNADDARTRAFAERTPARKIFFSGLDENADWYLRDNRIVFEGRDLIATGEIPIRGRHNFENTMAAAAACHLAGAPLDGIAAAIRTFKAVEHRLEFVRTLNGVAYYNDSKATSVDATQKALDSFAANLWVILGGKDKGSDYTVLRRPLQEKAKAALLIGAAADKIESHLSGSVDLIRSATIDRAVAHAHTHAAPGDIVLLAPACASFDQFANYEERGRRFKELVLALGD